MVYVDKLSHEKSVVLKHNSSFRHGAKFRTLVISVQTPGTLAEELTFLRCDSRS